MKKGLTVVALIAIALMSVTAAQAYAPVIGNIPDVYISDAENNVAQTQDQNIFDYPNAFDFRDFVVDWDDPTTSILWSFAMPGGPKAPGNNLWLVDVNKTKDYTGPNWANPPGPPPPANNRRLTDPTKGIYTASFRATVAPQWPPWPAPPRATPTKATDSRPIIFYAGDGTDHDSRGILVWYVDTSDVPPLAGTTRDYLSSTAQIIIETATYDFASRANDMNTLDSLWTLGFSTAVFAGFSVPTWGSVAVNPLSMWAGTQSPNTLAEIGYFGRYYTPTDLVGAASGIAQDIIPYHSNSLYRLRFKMRTDQANPTLIPGFRLVSHNFLYTQSFERVFSPWAASPLNQAGWGLVASERNQDLYFQLPDAGEANHEAPDFQELVNLSTVPKYDARTMNVAWDILDFNVIAGAISLATGTIYVEEVEVDRFERPKSVPPVLTITQTYDNLVAAGGDFGPVDPDTKATRWTNTKGLTGEVRLHIEGTGLPVDPDRICLLQSDFADPDFAQLVWKTRTNEGVYGYDQGVLYRATYVLNVSAADAAREDWINFRLRSSEETTSLGHVASITRGQQQAPIHMAMVPPLDSDGWGNYYLVWSLPPCPPALVSALGYNPRISMAFDGVNIYDDTQIFAAQDDGGQANLWAIYVEVIPVPQAIRELP
jgi:hypothetical protein